MDLLSESKIDFMKYRKLFVWVSVALLTVSLVAVFASGSLNLGIDFVGGTQLTIKFQDEPDVDELRRIVTVAGFPDAPIQRFGADDANEVIIKTPTGGESQEGSQALVIGALDGAFNGGNAGRFDLNQKGADALAGFLFDRDPEGLRAGGDETARSRYEEVAAGVAAIRRADGLVSGWGAVEGIEEMASATLAALKEGASVGHFAVLGAENVGPQIGAELRRKGILAILLSLLGMLAYIWMRFELRFGVGALVAVIHDVLITVGLFALAGFEFNLTTIAGFLTLVGYSVNDSVVVFDRVRENLRRSRSRSLVETMNLSLNQTLSRTLLTSGTTLLTVGSLLVAGGDVLRGFAFIMVVGVVVGTYSSIYVASPFTIVWDQVFGRQARARRAGG